MKISHIHLCLVFLIVCSTHTYAENQVNLSYYLDNRDFNTLTLFVQNKSVGSGFSFWGFTDFHSDQDNTDERFVIPPFITEVRSRG